MMLDLDGRRFDVITLLDLIEHVTDPAALLKRCRQLLNPDGYVVVYTPNHRGLIVRVATLLHRLSLGRISRPVAEIFDGVHVVFFDASSLGSIMARRRIPTSGHGDDEVRSGSVQAGKWSFSLSTADIESVSPLVRGQFRLLMIGRALESGK